MKKYLTHYWDSFSGRLVIVVGIVFVLTASLISVSILSLSREVFTSTYGRSQIKVIDQIENQFLTLHENLLYVIESIDSSWAFRLYLTENNSLDNLQKFQNIYQMEHDLEQSILPTIESLNVVVIGMNGSHYLSRTETLSASQEEILNSPAAKNAFEESSIVHYTFSKSAYTMTTKNKNTVILSKALTYRKTNNIYGLVLITLTQEDLLKLYNHFITDNSSFYLTDEKGLIVASEDGAKVGKFLDTNWQKIMENENLQSYTTREDAYTILRRKLPFQNLTIYGVVDNQLALSQLFNLPFLIVICLIIIVFLLLFIVIYAQKAVKPLSLMVEKMSQVPQGIFTESLEVKGTAEIREVAITYNRMAVALKTYFEQLMATQKLQRQYEIKALQMQINPHFIYNTLTSIKILTYQHQTDKAVNTIDAFIALLRNTVSNTNEMISVYQEIENLKNYVYIITTRYGTNIHVDYFVSAGNYYYLLPKMILQPFLENAFFHAFPSRKKGNISIFIGVKNGSLSIEIVDDGIGMSSEKANRLTSQTDKKEYFSGIGISNVHERIRLLYGEKYGVSISSKENCGTKVMITLPIIEVQRSEHE